MPLCESASSALNAARASGVRPASEPPVTTASASPFWSIRIAMPIACAPEAHAVLTAKVGPRRSWRIDRAPAPALLIISGTASGETYSRAAFAQRVLAVDERGDAADAGAEHAADALGRVWERLASQPASASASAQAPARAG